MKTLLLIGSALFASASFGQDVFPAGVESKRVGMESVSASRGAPALLYNPANISEGTRPTSSWQPYVELGVISAEYAYEHKDFDQVHVQVRSPVATVGAIYASQKNWAAGFVLFPSKSGEIEIPGMPRRVGGETMALQVVSAEKNYKLAYGIATRLGASTDFGVSLVHGFEHKEVTANVIGAATPLVRQELDNRSTRVVAGLNQKIADAAIVNLALISPLTKKYSGEEQRATDASALPSATVGYDPATIGFGVQGKLGGRVNAQVATNYRLWSRGKGAIREGVTSLAEEADLKNVFETSASVGVHILQGWDVSGAYALLPSPWGNGYFAGDVGSTSKIGPVFGQANIVDRRVIALGVSHDVAKDQKVDLTFNNTKGSRSIADDGASPGFYQTNVSLLSLGTTLKL